MPRVPVSPVVLTDDEEACGGERGGHLAVAAHVLAHAVGQLDNAARRSGRLPAVGGDVQSVTGRKGEAGRCAGRRRCRVRAGQKMLQCSFVRHGRTFRQSVLTVPAIRADRTGHVARIPLM
jgi:hypothetical protein